jgi:hypothetical protein
MNISDWRQLGFNFTMGTGATTGIIEARISGTKEEMEEQMTIVLSVYEQLFNEYLRRDVKKKA